MDADAWIARLDYSPMALAEWKRQTGEEAAPKSREEPRWAEWKMFHRREFEKYLCRYAYLETRPLISWKTPLHDDLRGKLEELAANPRASSRWFTRSQWQDSRHYLSRQGSA